MLRRPKGAGAYLPICLLDRALAIGHSARVLLASKEVWPMHAQVCILNSAWQDYPQWTTGGEAVAYRAESLVDPDRPPFPGFAVATRPDVGPGSAGPVLVEVMRDEVPADLTLVHQSSLYISDGGVKVGNEESGLLAVDLPRGTWALQIWVDSQVPAEVSRVTFVVTAP